MKQEPLIVTLCAVLMKVLRFSSLSLGSVPRQLLGAAALRSFVSGHLVLHRPCRGSRATPPARYLTKPHRRLSSKFEAPSSEMPFEVRLRNSGQEIRAPGLCGRECFLEPMSMDLVSWDRGAGLSLCIRTQGSAGTGSTVVPRMAAGQLWRLQSRECGLGLNFRPTHCLSALWTPNQVRVGESGIWEEELVPPALLWADLELLVLQHARTSREHHPGLGSDEVAQPHREVTDQRSHGGRGCGEQEK